ncbi:hypothetical protein SIID45300_02230 [Candidatus Magnetaquicoccaceae bacterium FCR-1]|uniref:Uncharacterized protein n=1 Tax=Candidatus Magnetaquiglobus chichijimensis TaxID=3141448 RepID=A0ABQ0CAI7_9PROT
MKVGSIVAVNAHRGMFIVAIENGDYAVFELLNGIKIAVGDRIRGDLDALGGEELVHLSSGKRFSAYGQSGPSSLAACQRLL